MSFDGQAGLKSASMRILSLGVSLRKTPAKAVETAAFMPWDK
jgi:hypothetical protein